MTFNSLIFLVFLAIFFPLYFATRGTLRIWICLIASYIFYGWWDYRFLALIGASTLMDYAIGLLMQRTEDPVKRRLLIIVTVVVNLSFLGFFKYFNFFIDSFHAMSDAVGLGFSPSTLNITLPIGISFYTFMSMSYTIDVYRRELAAERSLLKFATFIAFFPAPGGRADLAGPRPVAAVARLPQDPPPAGDHRPGADLAGVLQEGRRGGRVGAGGRQGFQRAGRPFVDGAVGRRGALRVSDLLRFCGLLGHRHRIGPRSWASISSPIFARRTSRRASASSGTAGTSRSRPGSAITCTFPLGGNRYGTFNTYRNLMLTMLLGGLWHGADWKFVIWGALHGLYLVLQRLIGKRWDRLRKALHCPTRSITRC